MCLSYEMKIIVKYQMIICGDDEVMNLIEVKISQQTHIQCKIQQIGNDHVQNDIMYQVNENGMH